MRVSAPRQTKASGQTRGNARTRDSGGRLPRIRLSASNLFSTWALVLEIGIEQIEGVVRVCKAFGRKVATGAGIYGSGVMPAKETELLSIAFDASYTHMYAPGTRRHIHNALQAGATMDEIMEVLKRRLLSSQDCGRENPRRSRLNRIG